MKTQEERNTALEHSLDKILGKIEKLSLQEEPPIAEDKGSNVKGKPITHIHKSTHFRPPHQQGSRYFYIPPDSTKAQFFTGSEHGETTRDQDMRETEYDLHDCPWSEMELAVFYEAANRDQNNTLPPSALYTHKPPHLAVHTVPTQQMDYQPQINHRQHHFASQMQFQQKVVAKEPKLTFPEFDGTDPDGWIRKSKKFFELAAVPTEVNSVMYLSGKAEYWWRGTGCNPSTLPWHQFCRLLEDRFLEISTTEIIGQFHNLNQTATVPKYIDMFEEFMGLVKRNNPSL